MGKLIPLLFAGAGTATVSVGGFYLVKGRGSVISDGSPEAPAVSTTSTTVQNLEFDTLEAFKKDMKNSDCVKNYFGEIIDKPEASDISSSSPDTASFFKTPSSGTYQSCLFINGKVTSYSGDKWNGKFTGLGTFMIGDEGFITFNVAETSDEEAGKLKFTGIFYLVGKNGSDWTIKHKKIAQSNITADSTNLDTYFPKAADDLKGEDGDYWGFVDPSEKLQKACKTNECGEVSSSKPKLIKKKLTFTNGTDQTKKLDGWSGTSAGGEQIYGTSDWNLKSKISGFYGSWGCANSKRT